MINTSSDWETFNKWETLDIWNQSLNTRKYIRQIHQNQSNMRMNKFGCFLLNPKFTQFVKKIFG